VRVELVVASGEVVLSGGRPRAADAEATDARAAEARERLW
jgi:hypothetical protein